MQIDLNSQEHEIVKLLAGLKNTNSAYPPKLLASRRLNFLKRVAEIGMGADVKNIHKEKSKRSKSTSTGLLEILLVAAVLVETIYVTYLYRERIYEVIYSIFTML